MTGMRFAGANPASAHDLRYSLATQGHVSLRIYDLSGRVVRTLVDQAAAAGTFSAHWDGHTDSGATVRNGMYFARFAVDGKAADTRKIVLE